MTLFEFLDSPLVSGIVISLFVVLVIQIVVGAVIGWKESVESQEFAKARAMTDKERIEDLERQLAEMTAACEAARAEVPPLDRWRVLATAMEVARRDYQESDSGTERESGFRTVYWSTKALFNGVDLLKNDPYPLKD
jgi:multidrug resistance efflux pump